MRRERFWVFGHISEAGVEDFFDVILNAGKVEAEHIRRDGAVLRGVRVGGLLASNGLEINQNLAMKSIEVSFWVRLVGDETYKFACGEVSDRTGMVSTMRI